MQAIRNIYTVENNQIIINLPKSFANEEVEVIILPVAPNTKRRKKNIPKKKEAGLTKLLSVSVWSDEDSKPIVESQNLINQWKVEEF
jgi:hypothetical protein